MGISGKLLDSVAAYVFVPPSVYQRVFISHRHGQVDESDLVLIVHARILPHNPAPSATAIFVDMFAFISRLDESPRYRCLHYRAKIIANCDCAPRGCSRQRQSRRYASVAVILFRHRECYFIEPIGIGIAQVRCAIAAVNVGFAEQYPAVVARVEQSRECESVPVLRRFAHWSIGPVGLLVTWFRAFPTYHRIALRSEESCCAFGEVKSSVFLFYHNTATLVVTWNLVAESHIIVAHAECDIVGVAVGIFQVYRQLVGLIVYERLLDAVLQERTFYLTAVGRH